MQEEEYIPLHRFVESAAVEIIGPGPTPLKFMDSIVWMRKLRQIKISTSEKIKFLKPAGAGIDVNDGSN